MLTVVPLGGLGQIGNNCMVLEQAGERGVERVLLDCGVSFSGNHVGVDLRHPRFDYLLDDVDALRALVLTHGHEDHVGAVAYLVKALQEAGRTQALAIWGPPYALAVASRRLDEAGIDASAVQLKALKPTEQYRIDSFTVEPIRVTHSIPDAVALCVTSCVGKVIHTGDFKLDEAATDGQPTDENRLQELGDEGVALLLSDSTNSLQAGHTGGEHIAAKALDEAVGAALGRVVVSLFASNVHRVRSLGEAAQQHGRRICLLGRSLQQHVETAHKTGDLAWPDSLTTSPELAERLPDHEVLYLVTGTQAEPRGALRRLASGTHGSLKLKVDDTVIMSSRIIPGNEQAVFGMMNALVERGVRLITPLHQRSLHVSGHAHREEQQRMLKLVRPRAFIPVHGTLLQMHAHAEMAQSLGVPQTLIRQNGETAYLDSAGLRAGEPVVAGLVARAFGQTIDAETVRQRHQLARGGIIFVAARRGAGGENDGQAVVQLNLEGIPALEGLEGALLATARQRLTQQPDGEDLAESIRRGVRRRAEELLGSRPVVRVVLLD